MGLLWSHGWFHATSRFPISMTITDISGHVQVLLNMLAFGYNPQTALDAPRIVISPRDAS